MALVDYMGFRVVAMSVLPINNKTLVYGTNDGGVVIHNSNFKLHELMKQAAEIINIKKHICGLRTASGKRLKGWQELYSPADLEGHCGDDGSFYLVDFARTMPPEAPPPNNKKRQHLYKLLRPEFVKAWDIPLCPDSFSGFILADDNYNVHNQQVKVATEYLYHEHIPRFVRDSLVWQIIEAKERNKLHKFPLTEAIHSKGICLRHIGLILYNVRDEEEFKIVKIVLVIEAIARVLKNKLRGLLRRKMKSLKQPLEAPYRHLVVKFLNLVFGTSQASEEFWQNIIKPQLKSKFVITGIWTDPIFPLKTWLVNNSHALCACLHLFNRVVSLTGLKFTNLALNKFKGPISFGQLIKEPYPFDDTYLHEIGYRVKVGFSDFHSSFPSSFLLFLLSPFAPSSLLSPPSFSPFFLLHLPYWACTQWEMKQKQGGFFFRMSLENNFTVLPLPPIISLYSSRLFPLPQMGANPFFLNDSSYD